jgi:hypothetical protein
MHGDLRWTRNYSVKAGRLPSLLCRGFRHGLLDGHVNVGYRILRALLEVVRNRFPSVPLTNSIGRAFADKLPPPTRQIRIKFPRCVRGRQGRLPIRNIKHLLHYSADYGQRIACTVAAWANLPDPASRLIQSDIRHTRPEGLRHADE